MRITSYSNIKGWNCVCVNRSLQIKLGNTLKVRTHLATFIGKLVAVYFAQEEKHLIMDDDKHQFSIKFKNIVEMEVVD